MFGQEKIHMIETGLELAVASNLGFNRQPASVSQKYVCVVSTALSCADAAVARLHSLAAVM
jgi:hypothetical protein